MWTDCGVIPLLGIQRLLESKVQYRDDMAKQDRSVCGMGRIKGWER